MYQHLFILFVYMCLTCVIYVEYVFIINYKILPSKIISKTSSLLGLIYIILV